MTSTTKEIVWLHWLLADMGFSLSHPTPMYCDNQSSIQITHNSVFNERTKHIEIDCHLTRHHLNHGTITLPFFPSSLLIWDFSFLIPLLCIVTTRVLFRLLTTRFFMSELSTLRSIVILLVIILIIAPLFCLLFLLPCRLQIFLPSRISSLVFVFYLTNS